MVSMSNITSHFSQVASQYHDLRNADREPIEYMAKILSKFTSLEVCDVGCGSGKYDALLLQHLGNKLQLLHCIDENAEMLSSLEKYLSKQFLSKVKIHHNKAEQLPLEDKSLDALLTFNAIHHFHLPTFLIEVARVLRSGGYFFVYTRLRSQNNQSIWGKDFPLFIQKENRLYELEELKLYIAQIPSFQITTIKTLTHHRQTDLADLIDKAMSHHYSTFHLYTPEEFRTSLQKFVVNVRTNYHNLNAVSWTDQNVLFSIQKK